MEGDLAHVPKWHYVPPNAENNGPPRILERGQGIASLFESQPIANRFNLLTIKGKTPARCDFGLVWPVQAKRGR